MTIDEKKIYPGPFENDKHFYGPLHQAPPIDVHPSKHDEQCIMDLAPSRYDWYRRCIVVRGTDSDLLFPLPA